MQDRQVRVEDISFKTENGKVRLDSGATANNGDDHSGSDHSDRRSHRHEAQPGGSSSFIPLSAVTRPAPKMDLATARARLAGKHGQQYWRSLEELADTKEFQELLQREFPRQAPRDMEPLSRREFLKLMGAGLALAGLSGCAYQPAEKIVPYVKQPEELVPGKPLFFASAMTMGGYALGILAESHMGRPIKLEGNPDHPASLGATDPFTQASLLTLYDPDRSQAVRRLGNISTWDNFRGDLIRVLGTHRAKRGAGLRILTEAVTSPTLASQLTALTTALPESRWHSYEPVNRDNVHAGAQLAFGADVQPLYHFDRAQVILSLDSDFLLEEPNRVRYSRDFINGRRVREGKTAMNRLYMVESTHTITGAMADHRLPMRSSDIEGFVRALAQQLGVAGITGSTTADAKWLTALAEDLRSQGGASLVVPGFEQPPIVHAIAHAINDKLGSRGVAVDYMARVEASSLDQMTSLRNLVDDMNAGRVETLIILGANPVYNAPADLKFKQALNKVPLRIHQGVYEDETSVECQWHIPESHYLEAWSDVRAYDGTVSIIQPLIQPLYASSSVHELLGVMLGQSNPPGYDILRTYWQGRFGLTGDAFEKRWRKVLHDGIVPDTAARPATVTLRPGFAAGTPQPAAAAGLEIVFRPDPSIWDGRFANNGWLQELPRPLTKITWDNAALISPATAEANKLSSEDIVELTYRGNRVEIPVWIMPGHADNSVTVHLGYGRTQAGQLGTGTGRCNAYALRSSDAPWFGTGVEIRRTGETYSLANTQHHHLLDAKTPGKGENSVDTTIGRDIIRAGAIQGFRKNSHFLEEDHHEGERASMYPPEWPSDTAQRGVQAGGKARGTIDSDRGDLIAPNQWGMVIDINACIGCNACTIACQAENNIPVVGKNQVERSREMHWIRIDTYYRGELDNPEAYFQPLPCMHCEKAPCEPVCPVQATSHSSEGINEMTYNRCIGTRYCSNNCPYKVRRFNFLQYNDQKSPVIQLMKNPDVTVRSRGVMEKCTYCVQRVNHARIEAEKEGRPIRDGEVVTACQQVCPTEAIIFGNIKDSNSQVAQMRKQPHNYGLLKELNTEPRTTYLARLRNPNPAIEPVAVDTGHRETEQGDTGHGDTGHGDTTEETGERKEHG